MNTPEVSYELSALSGSESVTLQNARFSHSVPDSTTQTDASGSEIETPLNAQQLPPVDGGLQAWMFCAASFVLETLVWGFGFSYGIFQGYYTSHVPFKDSSHIAIAAIGPTALAIQYGEGVFLSFLYARYPELLKPGMWFGLALAAGSLFLSSFVSRVELLILLQGIGLGIGSGMLYWPAMFLISEWFSQKRGLASGIVFAGSGIGGFVFPLIVNALLDAVEFRWTLRIWAAVMAILGVPGILGTRRRIPIPKRRPGQPRPRFVPRNMQFFKNRVFWLFSLSTLLQALSYFPVSLYIAIFAATISSPLSATVVLSLFNSSGVVGQVLIGYLTDRMAYPWIMFVSTLGSSIAAFLLWGFADTLSRVFAFAIVFGGLSGGFSSVIFPASADSAGPNPEQTPLVVSATMVVKGLAAVIGPIISGVLLEAGKSSTFEGKYGKFGFGAVEIFVGSCAAATSISSLAVAMYRPRTRP